MRLLSATSRVIRERAAQSAAALQQMAGKYCYDDMGMGCPAWVCPNGHLCSWKSTERINSSGHWCPFCRAPLNLGNPGQWLRLVDSQFTEVRSSA
jgi:hypothetical protein